MKDLKFKEKYNKEIVSQMKAKFGYKNALAIPKIEKVVVNIGVGRMSQQQNFQDKILPEIVKDLSAITGQKPKTAIAKKSIAGFKLRQGQTVGLVVTLRGNRLADFIDRLVKIVFPRVKDFRGIDLKNIDKNGNLSIGFKEHVVFPEISPETSRQDFGLEVTLVPNIKNREQAVELYRLIGVPLKK
jgi:large subunit ribosomal protein L5